ncbi:MAG: TRAP transporter small permease subunit [Alphaproteobacteria bacterium]
MDTIRKINVLLSLVGGYVLLLLSLVIVFEILARKLFSFSLQGVDEIGGYVVAGTGAFGFAYALIERTHTRIDIVLGHVPRLLRNSLNIFTYALVTGAALFITRYAYQALNESLLFNSHSPTPLQTPMWIPQGIWFAGLIVFSGTAIAMFVHLLIQNYRDSERAYFQYGPPTISEELHRELEDARARLERNEQDNSK